MELTNEEDGNGINKSNSYLCRQTSSRWTPTNEQIRILKELYYNNGVRSPSAEQIQKISAKLRQYGKIEGKNVFYWFQNHKARERQKKRLTAATATATTSASLSSSPSPSQIPIMHQQKCVWRSDDPFLYNKFPPANFSSGAPSSSAGMMPHPVNQFGKYVYGSMAVETSFRECSISQGGPKMQNLMWAGLDPYRYQYQSSSSYTFLEKKNYYYDETLDEEQEQEQEEEDDAGGLETLPLFPMHDEGRNGNLCNMKLESASMGCSRASLELTLSSYGCSMSPFSP